MIWLLPHLWILDHRFITNTERVDAEALVSPEIRAIANNSIFLSSAHAATCRGFLASAGAFEGVNGPSRNEHQVGSLASTFLSLLSGQPISGDLRDAFRLSRLANIYDEEAARHNSYITHQVGEDGDLSLSLSHTVPPRIPWLDDRV